MKLKVKYYGWQYWCFCAQEAERSEADSYDMMFEVREDLAKTWIEGNEYEEDKDFIIQEKEGKSDLLIPFIDPNQLKLDL